MKALIIALTICGAAGAAENTDFVLKKFEGKVYATPAKLPLAISYEGPADENSCQFGRVMFKTALTDFENYCGEDGIASACESLKNQVKMFATIQGPMNWGPVKQEFHVSVDMNQLEGSESAIAARNGFKPEDVVLLLPDHSEVLKKGIFKFPSSGEKTFYQEIMKTFGYKAEFGYHRASGIIRTTNRLEACLFMEKERSISGTYQYQMELKSEIPESEIASLYETYKAVVADYNKVPEKDWENSLHKVLFIGASLTERAKEHQSPVMKLTELYRMFFDHYPEDDTIYVRKQSRQEIAGNLSPARKLNLSVNIELEQE